MAEPLVPGRRRLGPLAPLWSGACAEALFPLPTQREQPAMNEGIAA